MPAIVDLPLELIEYIILILDPSDVSYIAQASRLFREIVYGPNEQQFWRSMYLAQPLDDPRKAVTRLGSPRKDINWRVELQRIIQAHAVVTNVSRTGAGFRRVESEERCRVMQTLLDLVSNVPPLPFRESEQMSRNIYWVQNLLRDGSFLECEEWVLTEEEEQLRARLHTWYGLTQRDGEAESRQASQAYVYSRRHYTASRSYGPFMPDGSMRVNWVHVRALAHVFGLILVELEGEEEEFAFDICPMGLLFCQSIIPPGLNLDEEDDWADVEGLWRIGYAFVDHREFIIYNDPRIPENEPLDTSIFEGAEETYSSIDLYFRVIDVEPDPLHQTRPKINFIGELDGNFTLMGFVKLTADDQVWWHFGGGNDNQPVWNGDAVGLGNIRSQNGAVGLWSTVFHDDAEDPIGPFWMNRQIVIEVE
ncbi:hypothetical protein PAXRUDRAFT_16695 [Paxillus rubicundulus Ve08.2h10]|uniref:F-box domain-containing protein n=1 Tax=Paxillus rubicundulus Ve08.2h10 TaxID=930991 RepID=A0A0D0DDG1_9AGAM|nr:hypothetical protein PAXRUDRAFT_16695 [Paxillus rubicundulus Ve08.2h10]